MHTLSVAAPQCSMLIGCSLLTHDGGEAAGGLLAGHQLVELGVVELQALQEGHVPPLPFGVEDVEQTAWQQQRQHDNERRRRLFEMAGRRWTHSNGFSQMKSVNIEEVQGQSNLMQKNE